MAADPRAARPVGRARGRPGDVVLFDPRTRDAVLRRTGRNLRIACLGASLLAGALAAGYHYEEPFLPYLLGACAPEVSRADCAYDHLLDVAAGLAVAAAFGALCFVMYRLLRSLRPTVFCRRCGGAGWIEDLQASAGRCPRCRHDRFDYRARLDEQIHPDVWTPDIVLDADDIAGEALLALKAEHGERLA